MAVKYLSGKRLTALSTDLVVDKDITWSTSANVTVSGGQVTKNSGGTAYNAGTSSTETSDKITFTNFTEGNYNTWAGINTGSGSPPLGFTGIFWRQAGTSDMRIMSDTTALKTLTNTISSSDTYEIRNVSGTAKFYKNGTEQTGFTNPSYPSGVINTIIYQENSGVKGTLESPRLGTSGAPDGLGSDADLTLSGTTSYNTGLVGKCLYADFSGTEGQQGTPAGNFFSQGRTNNDDFNFIHTNGEAWTINFWVKPTVAENGAIQQLIGNESYTGSTLSGFNIKILDRSASSEVRRVSTDFKNDGNVIYSAYNGTDGDMPNNTNWAMITVRCNGATTSGATALDICINGGTSNNDFSTPNGTCTRSSSTATARNATYGLMFGRNLLKRWGSTNAHADPFDGSFDEVSIWNRELTDAECVALYNSGSGAVTTTAVTNHSGLKAYWNFNDTVENQAKLTDIAVTVPNGSVAEETDTGKHQIWNSTTSTWTEIS